MQDRLLRSRAYWVSESIIAWNVYVSDGSCYLYASKNAVLSVTDDGIQGLICFIFITYHIRSCNSKVNICKVMSFTGEDVRIKLQVDSCRLPTKVLR